VEMAIIIVVGLLVLGSLGLATAAVLLCWRAMRSSEYAIGEAMVRNAALEDKLMSKSYLEYAGGRQMQQVLPPEPVAELPEEPALEDLPPIHFPPTVAGAIDADSQQGPVA